LGVKRTRATALHMSAFEGKADIMFDPKRTSVTPPIGASRACAYEERNMALIFYLRAAPWSVVFCRIAYAVAAAADLFNAGRALGIFSSGRLRHWRIRPLGLGLYATPAAQGTPPAHRQACRRDRLRDRCDHLPLASGSMAEFDPRADEARASRHDVSTRSRPDCIGGFRNPLDACAILSAYASLGRDRS